MAATLEKVLLNATHGFDNSWTLPDDLQLWMLPDLLRVYNEKNPQTVIKWVTNLRTLCDVMNDVSCSSKTGLKITSHSTYLASNFSHCRKIFLYSSSFEDLFAVYYVLAKVEESCDDVTYT